MCVVLEMPRYLEIICDQNDWHGKIKRPGTIVQASHFIHKDLTTGQLGPSPKATGLLRARLSLPPQVTCVWPMVCRHLASLSLSGTAASSLGVQRTHWGRVRREGEDLAASRVTLCTGGCNSHFSSTVGTRAHHAPSNSHSVWCGGLRMGQRASLLTVLMISELFPLWAVKACFS